MGSIFSSLSHVVTPLKPSLEDRSLVLSTTTHVPLYNAGLGSFPHAATQTHLSIDTHSLVLLEGRSTGMQYLVSTKRDHNVEMSSKGSASRNRAEKDIYQAYKMFQR